MGLEGCLVAHGLHLLDAVAQVQIIDPVPAAEIDEIEDVHGAGAAPGLPGIEVEVDGVQPLFRAVDDGHADEPVGHPVADLEAAADGAGEKTGVILLGAAFTLRKPGPQVAIQEGQVLAAHAQGGDSDRDILVHLPDPALVAVGTEFPGPQPDRHAGAAARAAHGIDAVAVAPVPVREKNAERRIADGGEHRLMIHGGPGQPVRAVHADIDEILFQAVVDLPFVLPVRVLGKGHLLSAHPLPSPPPSCQRV